MGDERPPQAHPWGVGMPALLLLHDFGRFVHQAFGHYPVLVGSALRQKRDVRDIDVRLLLPTGEYLAQIGPVKECGQPGTRWAAFAVAFSAAGRNMTGLTIDFQIQPPAIADRYRGEQRLTLGYTTAWAEAYRPTLADPDAAGMARQAVAWATSPEGRAKLLEGQERANKAIEELQEARRVDPETLRIPMGATTREDGDHDAAADPPMRA